MIYQNRKFIIGFILIFYSKASQAQFLGKDKILSKKKEDIENISIETNEKNPIKFFFFNTNHGTYNVFCFNGTIERQNLIPLEPDEWIESFDFKRECEQKRAKSFNKKLSPIFKERIK